MALAKKLQTLLDLLATSACYSGRRCVSPAGRPAGCGRISGCAMWHPIPFAFPAPFLPDVCANVHLAVRPTSQTF